ncbi:MAG: PAS domain S-box protein [Bacteroidetes bacterium]|nr:PAS domain S-box protein [Bacteroidota bacterium]
MINSGQKYWSDEYRYRKKNGEYMNIYDRGYVSYDESGKPYRMIGSMLDITERIHAQEELKRSEEKYRTLVEQASDAIYITSIDGRILTVNPSACKLSGYTEEEIMKMNVMDFIFTEDLEKNPFRISELREGKTVVVERRFKVKDNRILHVECIANMLSDERILVFARDIGERIKAEALLKKSYEDIRNLASHLVKVRDEERRRIGREIHDELGQQLTAIKMDVAWVEKKIPEEIPQVKAKLKNMITLLDGSNKSVRKILKELTPAIIDDNGLLAALETQNRQFTELTGIAIDFHTNRKKITLGQEVANCIFRVYQESLTNIMKYANASRVVTSLDTSDTQVAVSIQDNGLGFDSLAFAKSNDKKSFGIIGMKERVLSLGGDFNLESIPGKGTTIVAHIPYNQA